MKKTKKRKLKKEVLYLLFLVVFVVLVVFLYFNNLIALQGNTLYFNYDLIKYLVFGILTLLIYEIIKRLINE